MTKKSPHDPIGNAAFTRGLADIKKKLAEAEEKARAESKKPAPKPPPPAPKKSAPEVWRPDMDARLYEIAMSGVTPLAQRGTERVSQRDVESARAPRVVAPEVRAKRRAAEGGAALPVTWSDDRTVSGAHRGREFALEALKRFATPDATLDLHRLDAVQARTRVADFVRTRRAQGLRCVSVITGYGKNSPDGASVLLDAVVAELCAPPTTTELDAFTTAPEHLGGLGAILVSLRDR